MLEKGKNTALRILGRQLKSSLVYLLVFACVFSFILRDFSDGIIIVFLLLLVNDREIMGEHANGRLGNFFGIAVTVFLVLAGLIFGITTVFPQLIPS